MTEDVALSRGEVVFEDVAGLVADAVGNTFLTGSEIGHLKLRWIDGGDGGVGTVGVLGLKGSDVAGEGGVGVAGGLDSEDGIVEGWEVSEEEAADGSVELVEAVGFAALEGSEAYELPAVGEFAENGVIAGEFRNLEDVLELEDVSAIEVGRGIGLAEVGRVASSEEETYVALLVEGVAVGVRDSELVVVREVLTTWASSAL